MASDPISFGVATLSGELSTNPTAIEFSKTGNPVLFVTQQDGKIYRYVVERRPDGADADTTDDFVVTDADQINVIPQLTQNYNDDGTVNSTLQRQVTGMAVTKDAAGNDVLYVSSSDWRIAVGNDSGLDTNSGQIHKIVLNPNTGSVISNVALVRGLPRSEENHATNGIDLSVDPVTGDTQLWIAVGGITNKGAPGNNFAGTVDLALSGAILKINLTDLESYDIRTDASGDQFILDLSTLDDPSRPNVNLAGLNIQNLNSDPNFTLDDNGSVGGVARPEWAGGNNGLNQAKITKFVLVSDNGQLKLVDNPLSVHAPGYRNPYDVLVTSSGEVFTWDNGPNSGWGGQPISFNDGQIVNDWKTDLATNLFNESGSTPFGDQLHYLGEIDDQYGPYGGHAAPIRAAKEALQAAFNTDGTYKGTTPTSPITVDGKQLFANEAQARDFLAKLLVIYEEQGDGNWVDVTSRTGLPPDLFDVVSGYDWKHPGSSLSNPLAFFDGASVMDGTPYSPESQLLDPTVDGSLVTTPETTNGLTEYRGSFFSGALQGTIVAASFNETLYFARPVDTDGDGRTDSATIVHTITNFGSNPLAVASLPDFGLSPELIDNNGDGIDDFAGLLVAANHGNDNIVFFIPGGTLLDPGNDLDLDGLNNVVDSHVGDPLDGTGVMVRSGQTARWGFELNNPSSTPPGAVPAGDSIAGDIGINAVWRNGVLPQVDNQGNPSAGLYNGSVWNLGGASSFVSIDRAHGGAAEGTANSQQDVLGIGFAAQGASQLSIVSEMANIFTYSPNNDPPEKVWNGGEKVGLFVGPGDQSNFAEATIAVVNQGGTIKYGVQLIVEQNDSFVSRFVEIPGIQSPVVQGLGDPNFQVAIDLDLSFGNETASARARYVNNGVFTNWVSTPAVALPSAVVAAVKGQFENQGVDTGAVVGLVSSTTPGDDSFAASWDWVEVQNGSADGQVVHRWNAGSATVAAIDGGPNWTNDTSVLVGGPTNVSTHDIPTLHSSVPSTTPLGIFAQERWDPATGAEMQFEFNVAPGDYEVRLYMGNGASGTSLPGARVFDVSIEGALAFDNVDLSQQFGHDIGGMVRWIGTVQDGKVDIDFQRVVQNPLINGIEIIALNNGQAGPAISVADASGSEGSSTLNVAIQASTAVPASQIVQVSFAVKPIANGATPGVDYTVPNATFNSQTGVYTGTISIPGGASTANVPITIINDQLVEQNEQFQVEITNVTGAGASIGDGLGVVTILDNDSTSGTGAVRMGIKETSNAIQTSNFGAGSFVLTNVGQKVVTKVEIDVSEAVLTDAVFDPFGLAGDTVSKALTIDSAGSTGVIAPSNQSYVGAGGTAGYEGIVLNFDQGVNGGFQSGETITFSVDMDPNSVAGAKKTVLQAGSSPSWDVGGVSGAELIGSKFTVTYADGTTSTGYLHGANNQGGSKGLSSQASPNLQATLSVNGLDPGEAGTYEAGGPTVVVSGPAGQTARVVLVKGFIQPVTNEFHNGSTADKAYAPQLDAQLAALRASAFPANNAVEVQTIDVVLTGGAQNISHLFNFSGVAALNFGGEDQVPLAFTAAVINPSNSSLPLGPVTEPIWLKFDSGSSDATAPVVQSASAPDIGSAAAGTASTTVSVVFADNVAVDVSTIDVGDITVTGPSGALAVTSVSVSSGTDGSPRTASYTVAAPGGSWNAADDGNYSVALDAGEVLDTSGNAVAANASMTGFSVDLSTPSPDPFRVEAETFNVISGFVVKANSSASGGQMLQAGGSTEQRASYSFQAAGGNYDLKLGYYDESDGQSQLSVKVNGTVVDSFVWNLDLPSTNANGITRAVRAIEDVTLSTGDVIEIAGVSNGGEPLRVDYLDFNFDESIA